MQVSDIKSNDHFYPGNRYDYTVAFVTRTTRLGLHSSITLVRSSSILAQYYLLCPHTDFGRPKFDTQPNPKTRKRDFYQVS